MVNGQRDVKRLHPVVISNATWSLIMKHYKAYKSKTKWIFFLKTLPQTPVIPIQIKRFAHVVHRVMRAPILWRDLLSSAGSLLSRSYSWISPFSRRLLNMQPCNPRSSVKVFSLPCGSEQTSCLFFFLFCSLPLGWITQEHGVSKRVSVAYALNKWIPWPKGTSQITRTTTFVPSPFL